MSLLMQALQKAAKEREGAVQPQAPRGLLAGELALEPLELESRQGLRATGSSSSGPAVGPTPAQAAAVLQATEAKPRWIDWLRDHRKQAYGMLIGLAVVGYAVYFYLSVYHPALLRRPFSSPVAAVAPTPPPAAAVRTSPPATAAQLEVATVVPEANLAPPRGETVLAPRPPTPGKAVARRMEVPEAQPVSAPAAKPAVPPEAAMRRQARDSISVKPGGEVPRLNPQLADAYEALRSGRIDEAGRLYDSLLKSEPRNIDALLGRAMVAQQQGNPDLATRYLFQVLQVDPSNALAQGGLINLIGRADPQSAASKLKSLIAREPSAFLYFALGNLYADQGDWPSAQAAYFQAHHLERGNPDYAFNLAVSLEHLSQPKLARSFYQQALELARISGRANFDSAAVQERIARLAAGVD
jgi:Flp pilus assembly protein TadD